MRYAIRSKKLIRKWNKSDSSGQWKIGQGEWGIEQSETIGWDRWWGGHIARIC